MSRDLEPRPNTGNQAAESEGVGVIAALTYHIQKQCGLEVLLSEDFTVPETDPNRYTAALVSSAQIDALSKPGRSHKIELGSWDSIQDGSSASKYLALPRIDMDPVDSWLRGNPFQASASTPDVAIALAYADFVRKNTQSQQVDNEPENIH